MRLNLKNRKLTFLWQNFFRKNLFHGGKYLSNRGTTTAKRIFKSAVTQSLQTRSS